MAESIEAYHVPQQSRRDKLRVISPSTPSTAVNCSSLLPFYDPSLISPEYLTAVNIPAGFPGPRFQYHPYFDPQSSLTSLPDHIEQNPVLYSSQNHCYGSVNGTEIVTTAFKPEPLSLSLSSQPYLGSIAHAGSNNVLSKSLVPLGPFTGYASILKGSRFLKPAQQLLEEVCQVVRVDKASVDSGLIDPISDSLSDSGIVDDPLGGGGGGGDGNRGNKSRLVSMLEEVFRRYKQYYQQIQEVMTSFEYISGLGNAAPFANQAIKAMYKHFKCLKNAILDQLQFTKKTNGDYCQRSVHSSGFLDHQPVWRPQRGLPERAVSVLRAWLFEHFLHPYPSDTDKLMLAKQTGLSRSQVSNWFINARVRLWKPMVEEIYTLETKQTQKNLQREERNAIQSNDHHPSSNSLASDDPSTSAQQVHDTLPKRNRNEPHDIQLGNQEPLNVSYNLSSHPHMGANANMAANNGGVSLTLGLHQNDGVGFSEPFPVGFPVTASRRFGLNVEANNNGYVMGGFEAQNRHFGRDVLGGQLLHDFVG